MASSPTSVSFLKRLLDNLPGMLQGGIDAAATPNIAFGGPVDFFRGLQSVGDRRFERSQMQLQNELARQTLELRAREGDMRAWEILQDIERKDAQVAAAQAQAEADKAKAQLETDKFMRDLYGASREGGTVRGVSIPGTPTPSAPLTPAQNAILAQGAEELPDQGVSVRPSGMMGVPFVLPTPSPMREGYTDTGLRAPSGRGRLIAPTAARKAEIAATGRAESFLRSPTAQEVAAIEVGAMRDNPWGITQADAKSMRDLTEKASTPGSPFAAALAARRSELGRDLTYSEIVGLQRTLNPDDPAIALSPNARTYLADLFNATAIMPSLGTGASGAAARAAVIEQAAERHPGANLALNRSSYRALSNAQTDINRTLTRTRSFETTARANLDRALEAAKQIKDSGSPLLNRVFRGGDRTVFGNDAQARFDAARVVAFTEVSRVLNNPTGAGVVSDTARREAEEILSGNYTISQLQAAAELLKQDMTTRIQSLEGELQGIEADLKVLGGVEPEEDRRSPITPAATHRYNPATGRIEEVPAQGVR